MSELVRELKDEKRALLCKQESLETEIRELQKQLVNNPHVTRAIVATRVKQQSSELEGEELENETSGHSELGEISDSSSSQEGPPETRQRQGQHERQTRIRDPHPLGFKTLIHRVENFVVVKVTMTLRCG